MYSLTEAAGNVNPMHIMNDFVELKVGSPYTQKGGGVKLFPSSNISSWSIICNISITAFQILTSVVKGRVEKVVSYFKNPLLENLRTEKFVKLYGPNTPIFAQTNYPSVHCRAIKFCDNVGR